MNKKSKLNLGKVLCLMAIVIGLVVVTLGRAEENLFAFICGIIALLIGVVFYDYT